MKLGSRLALRLAAPAVSSAILLLTGCGFGVLDTPQSSVTSAAFTGKVFGGQQPVKGSTITVWAMNSDATGTTSSLATTTSDPNGNFAFAANAYTCPFANTPVYITAAGGDAGSGTNTNLVMAAGLGACSSAKTATVNINEVSTVVTALALGHYFNGTIGGAPTSDLFGAPGQGGSVYNVGLVAANSVGIPAILNIATGLIKPDTATRTVESAKIYSMANSLAACVNSSGQTSTSELTTPCGILFNLNRVGGGALRPLDTLQAAVRMVLAPYQNVSLTYNIATASSPFVGLPSAPNDWTVAIAYTSSAMALGINGTANTVTSASMDVDANGRIWFPSSKTGANGVGYFDPASQSFNGPYGGATLAHPQYVAVDNAGIVWSTDLSSGNIAGINSTTPTTVTTFNIPGATMGPLALDSSNLVNIAYTSAGNFSFAFINSARTQLKPLGAAFVQNPTGLSAGSAFYAATSNPGSQCSLEENGTDGSTLFGSYVEVSTQSKCNSGAVANDTAETATMTASTTNQICDFRDTVCRTPVVTLSNPQGIAVDGDGDLWIANSGNASVSTLHGYGNGTSNKYATTSNIQYLHGVSNGSTLTTPFGIAVDRSGNVWVLNPGCVTIDAANPCAPTSMTLTEILGAAAPTMTPLAIQASTQFWARRPFN